MFIAPMTSLSCVNPLLIKKEVFRRCYRRFLELIADGKSYDEIIDEALYG